MPTKNVQTSIVIRIFLKLLEFGIIQTEGFIMAFSRIKKKTSMLIVLSRMKNVTVNICNYNHAFYL